MLAPFNNWLIVSVVAGIGCGVKREHWSILKSIVNLCLYAVSHYE